MYSLRYNYTWNRQVILSQSQDLPPLDVATFWTEGFDTTGEEGGPTGDEVEGG